MLPHLHVCVCVQLAFFVLFFFSLVNFAAKYSSFSSTKTKQKIKRTKI